jgi:hypothetical protein
VNCQDAHDRCSPLRAKKQIAGDGKRVGSLLNLGPSVLNTKTASPLSSTSVVPGARGQVDASGSETIRLRLGGPSSATRDCLRPGLIGPSREASEEWIRHRRYAPGVRGGRGVRGCITTRLGALDVESDDSVSVSSRSLRSASAAGRPKVRLRFQGPADTGHEHGITGGEYELGKWEGVRCGPRQGAILHFINHYGGHLGCAWG